MDGEGKYLLRKILLFWSRCDIMDFYKKKSFAGVEGVRRERRKEKREGEKYGDD